MRESLSRSFRRTRQVPAPQEDPEIAAQEHQSNYHEDDRNFRREEFEDNLREMGLELEKDEGVSAEVGFINVTEHSLSHPAYQCHSYWNLMMSDYIFHSSLSFDIMQTMIPGMGFLKIHAPWSVLCREAEFMKLKMPTKKVCWKSNSPLKVYWHGQRFWEQFFLRTFKRWGYKNT